MTATLLASLAASAPAGAPARPFTYLHWNIGHFAMGRSSATTIPADEGGNRGRAYGAFLARLDADVVGCSEFDPVFDLAGRKTIPLLFPSYDVAIEGPKNNYQCNAIFSRGLEKVAAEIVDYTERHQSTYFIDATYRIDGHEVHFVQTHLDWNSGARGETARPRQIRELIERFSTKSHVVIGGDFNVYSAAEYAPFVEAGYTPANCGPRGELPTCQGEEGVFHAIDNIIVKGFAIEKVRTADPDYGFSDHRPLLCTLRLLP